MKDMNLDCELFGETVTELTNAPVAMAGKRRNQSFFFLISGGQCSTMLVAPERLTGQARNENAQKFSNTDSSVREP
jgi:hypothetical protein